MTQFSQFTEKGLQTLINWLEKENVSHPMKPDPQSSSEIVEKVNIVDLNKPKDIENKRRNSLEVISARSQKVEDSDFDLAREVKKKVQKNKEKEKKEKQDDSQKIAHEKKFEEEAEGKIKI